MATTGSKYRQTDPDRRSMEAAATGQSDEPDRALIEVDALTVEYPLARQGSQVVALESINLDIPEGEFLTVVGPSGCGKTTLLNAIAGW